MLAEITREDYVQCLDDVVADLLIAAGVTAPPVDALVIAERLGILVAVDDRQPGRARCARFGTASKARRLIFVRPEPRAERGQWALAHEIGEHSCGHVFARLGVDPREAPAGTRERVADLLARRLILPTAWFVACGLNCGWDLFELKQAFPTASHELIARRMLDCEPPIVITIFDHGRVTFRRANVAWPATLLSSDEQACRRRAARTLAPARLEAQAGNVSAWPIHEPDWPREIVRMELPILW